MPTLCEIERSNAIDVHDRLTSAARETWTGAFARMIPGPVYPGGPVQCPAHDVAAWSADKIAAQGVSVLLAVCKDLADNALADLPQSAKDYLDTNSPGWSGTSDAVGDVANVLEAFPAE